MFIVLIPPIKIIVWDLFDILLYSHYIYTCSYISWMCCLFYLCVVLNLENISGFLLNVVFAGSGPHRQIQTSTRPYRKMRTNQHYNDCKILYDISCPCLGFCFTATLKQIQQVSRMWNQFIYLMFPSFPFPTVLLGIYLWFCMVLLYIYI